MSLFSALRTALTVSSKVCGWANRQAQARSVAGVDPLATGAMRAVAGVFGAALVLSTFVSAVKTVVVPRGATNRLTRVVFVITRYFFEFRAHPGRPFRDRDRILSLWAPIGLLTLPFAWSICMTLGYTGLHWGVGGGSAREAFLRSGSSWFTLGTASSRAFPLAVLSFFQAAMGILLTALLVSYLPSIYGAYQRREALVGLLEGRAGLPPHPAVMLTRYERIGALNLLDEDVFEKWEQWFVEVEESHLSFAALAFFRSPRMERSWITAAGCVLDVGAIKLSCIDIPFSGRTALCIRTGFLALGRIAEYFNVPFDEDPQPTDPISVTRAEFDMMLVELVAAGIPLKTDHDQMWTDFCGWRVNYDKALIGLAKLVVAPDGRWSSDREADRYVPRMGFGFGKRPSRVHQGGRLK